MSQHCNSVVALLGWLGAQPKSLHRYETLYRTTLGVSTVATYIAPPFTIVQTILSPNMEPIQIPMNWPHIYCDNIRTTQDLAWNVLKGIHDVPNCDHFYVHAFSNGGCFVWEKIREILLLTERAEQGIPNNDNDEIENYMSRNKKTAKLPQDTANVLMKLRQQLNGVVFDSCPISDLHRLPDALQYCSLLERLQVLRYCGFDYLSILTNPQVKERVQQRIESYVTGLQNDTSSIQQLYLYGRDDPLAPAPFIDELIQHRKQRLQYLSKGNNQVASCVWDKSRHCGHLLQHPQEYTNAIEMFLNQEKGASSDVILRSKL
jgi:Eukaryotic protein of unknown function (DUF829)